MVWRDTFIPLVGERETGRCMVGTARCGNRVGVVQTCLVEIFNVIVLWQQGILAVVTAVVVDTLRVNTAPAVYILTYHLCTPAAGCTDGEASAGALAIYILVFVRIVRLAEGKVTVVFDLQLTRFTFLRCYDDGTVLRTRTVKCGSVGTFQNGDGFDVVRIDHGCGTTEVDTVTAPFAAHRSSLAIVDRHTVDNPKRLVVTAQRGGTTEDDTGRTTHTGS